MRKLFERYRDVIPYLFFGVCTTFVNIVVYWICAHLFSMGVMPSTIFAWIGWLKKQVADWKCER